MLELNSLVRIGLFDVDLATVDLNKDNMPYLDAHFQELDTARIGVGVGGSAGYWADSFNVDTRASQNSLGGKLLYVWAFKSTNNTTNALSFNTATKQTLFTLNTSLWQLPTDSEIAPSSLSIDVSQLASGGVNTKVLQGTFPTTATGDGGTTHVGLVAIPEPSSAMLAAVGLLTLVRRRR